MTPEYKPISLNRYVPTIDALARFYFEPEEDHIHARHVAPHRLLQIIDTIYIDLEPDTRKLIEDYVKSNNLLSKKK